MAWEFHVGQKVVFVRDNRVTLDRGGLRAYIPFLRETKLTHNLVRGEVYRVAGVVTHYCTIHEQDIVCLFIDGFRFRESPKVAFPAKWFRPVQERPTDISIFRAILNGTHVPEDEHA